MKENKVLEAALLRAYPDLGEKLVEKVRANADGFNLEYPDIKDPLTALGDAFDWETSPEGFFFWAEVYTQLEKNNQKETSE